MPYDNLRKYLKNKSQDDYSVDPDPGFLPIGSAEVLGRKWLDDGAADSMPDPTKLEEGLRPPTLGLDPIDYVSGAIASKVAPKLAKAGSDMIEYAPSLLADETGAIGPISKKEAEYFKALDELAQKKGPGMQPYNESNLPHSQPVKVTFPDGEVHLDEVKGLNQGHALQRARYNWRGADVEPVSGPTAEQELAASKSALEDIISQAKNAKYKNTKRVHNK